MKTLILDCWFNQNSKEKVQQKWSKIFIFNVLVQIVLGDRSEQKAFKYTGITCFNPGSFSREGTFVAYYPCTQEVELSALEDSDSM